MRSPFPGMDPYLERHWGGVHNTLIAYAQAMLNERLPRDLRARTQERIVVEVLEVFFHEPETQAFLEIIESAPARRVITVIEIVSPTNKYAGPGREQYRQKQRDLFEGGISLVEVDLLRAGPYVLQLPWGQYPESHRTPYKVCVHRAGKASAEIYRVPLREPLPTIRVPLRSADADVPLELQSLIEQVYHHGRYDDMDYRLPPMLPLDPEDAVWADELLRAAGHRPANAV